MIMIWFSVFWFGGLETVLSVSERKTKSLKDFMSKQTNCHETWIFIHGVHSTGVAAGQMYTYPARCWRKKRRLHNSTDPRLGIYGLQLGKTLQPLLGMPPAHRSLLHSASPPTQPAPPRSPPTSFSSCDYWWWSGIISLKAYQSVSAQWAEQSASHFSEDEMWLCSPRLVNLFCEK